MRCSKIEFCHSRSVPYLTRSQNSYQSMLGDRAVTDLAGLKVALKTHERVSAVREA